jgi:hypothetical protein
MGSNKWVISKAFVQHPPKAFLKVGIFGFKRAVCEGNNCKVHKQAYCVNCNSAGTTGGSRRRNKPFLSRISGSTDEQSAKDFINNCVSKAFNSDGSQKAAYKCDIDAGWDSLSPTAYSDSGTATTTKIHNMELAQLALKAL